MGVCRKAWATTTTAELAVFLACLLIIKAQSHNYVLARSPVGRCGQRHPIGSLYSIEGANNFGKVTPYRHGVIHGQAYFFVRPNNKYSTHCCAVGRCAPIG